MWETGTLGVSCYPYDCGDKCIPMPRGPADKPACPPLGEADTDGVLRMAVKYLGFFGATRSRPLARG